jgi:hypothetical protein
MANYGLKNIDPTSGYSGGVTATISGFSAGSWVNFSGFSGFSAGQLTFVGPNLATNQVVTNSAVMTVKTPFNAPGTYDVVVVDPNANAGSGASAYLGQAYVELLSSIPTTINQPGGMAYIDGTQCLITLASSMGSCKVTNIGSTAVYMNLSSGTVSTSDASNTGSIKVIANGSINLTSSQASFTAATGSSNSLLLIVPNQYGIV